MMKEGANAPFFVVSWFLVTSLRSLKATFRIVPVAHNASNNKTIGN